MAKNMVLSNLQIEKLHKGLRALDGVPVGSETVRFEFSDNLSWNITKNLVLVERALEVYKKHQAKLMRDTGISIGEKVTDSNIQKVSVWKEKLDTLNENTQEISGLLLLKRADLQKAGVSKFPGIMANLFDLIEPQP